MPSTARSGSAHASRTCRWARRLCATRRSRARSSAAGEASYRDSSPRDASNGDHQPVPAASSTISPCPRQRIEPSTGAVELGVPGGVVDRAAGISAAAQVPIVVLGSACLVVVDHRALGVDGGVGGDGRGDGSASGRWRRLGDRRRRLRRRRALRAAADRSVKAWRRRKRRNPLSPALPTQSGQSCAQPSRSSGDRTVWAVPHHRHENDARNGKVSRPGPGSSRRAGRCPRTRPDP